MHLSECFLVVSAYTKIEFKNTFSPGFLLVFSALMVATITDQSINKQIEQTIQSPTGLSNMIFLWGALSLLSSLMFPLITSFLCCHTLAAFKTDRSQFLRTKFELGLIETLRAWGQTFIWCFAFIIPGLLKYTYYLLTPFVVIFSKNYEAGLTDALKMSEKISKLFWWKLNFWLAVFYMIVPIVLSSLLDERRLFRFHPVSATLCVVMETGIVFLFHYVILKPFIQLLNQIENNQVENTEVHNVTHV